MMTNIQMLVIWFLKDKLMITVTNNNFIINQKN